MAAAEGRIAAQEAEIEARGSELAERGRRIEELDQVATLLSDRVVKREGELRALRVELARVTNQGDAQLATLAAVIGELEDVRRQARGQATRIRMRALAEAAELSERLGELTKGSGGVRDRLLEGLAQATARIGSDGGEEGAVEAASNGRGEELAVEDLFQGLIEVEIGPLRDFAQLVVFEDAAKSIDAADGISITGFSEGRATLELSLREPVALLRELEERCDLDFAVRDMREDRVVLDVDA